MDEEVYTTFEISRFCSVDITTVMGWVDAGKLTAFKTPGGHRRILHHDLLLFLEKYKIPLPAKLRSPGKKIIIIDDDMAIVRMISKMIKKICGQVEIIRAHDGFTAGQMTESFLPDLVILDLYLPGIDGFQVCKRIRQNVKTRNTKILAITGKDTNENKKKILTSGANDYIGKPFQYNMFAEKLMRLLNIHQRAM